MRWSFLHNWSIKSRIEELCLHLWGRRFLGPSGVHKRSIVVPALYFKIGTREVGRWPHWHSAHAHAQLSRFRSASLSSGMDRTVTLTLPLHWLGDRHSQTFVSDSVSLHPATGTATLAAGMLLTMTDWHGQWVTMTVTHCHHHHVRQTDQEATLCVQRNVRLDWAVAQNRNTGMTAI
jgi:hypothetical protein